MPQTVRDIMELSLCPTIATPTLQHAIYGVCPRETGVLETDAAQFAKPKVCIIWPFTEKSCQPVAYTFPGFRPWKTMLP